MSSKRFRIFTESQSYYMIGGLSQGVPRGILEAVQIILKEQYS